MKRNYKLDVIRDANGNIKTVLAEDKSTGKVSYKFTVERDPQGSAKYISVEPK